MFLVLGGSGFIGIHLVDKLIKLGKVRVFDKDVTLIRKLFPKIDAVEGDITTCNYNSLLKNVDVVYHLISSTLPDEGTNNIEKDINQNIIPTIQLLESMAKYHINKIIFCSSGGTVYGETVDRADESTPLNPICVYGVQKLIIEKYLSLFERYHGIISYSMRVMNPYGLKYNLNSRQGIVPIFIHNILNNQPLEIWGDGNTVRDYIYIDDVIEALIKINIYSGKYRTFNIGCGHSYSLNQIADILCCMLNHKVEIIYKKSRKCDVRNSSVSIELAKNELAWIPQYSITEGIRILIHQMNKLY